MSLVRPFILGAACLALTACVATTAPGENGGTEQLRLSQTNTLRWAGVSDECIAQLDLNTLALVKGIASEGTRNSMDFLQQRQRIRTAVAKVCPEL